MRLVGFQHHPQDWPRDVPPPLLVRLYAPEDGIESLRHQLAVAIEALEHLASPNWQARPTGADAQMMATFAADALTSLRGQYDKSARRT